ncbi:MAG: MotE family protein [Opitutales bacterium]
MKFLQTAWGLALFALVVNVVTSVFLSIRMMDTILPEKEEDFGLVEGTAEHFNFFTREIDTLSDDLLTQIEDIEVREFELQRFEERLAAERAELERLRTDMQIVRDQLSKVIIEVQESEVKNIKNLASIYADMPPGDVIQIFRELEDDFIVKILTNMPRDAIGPIFMEMSNDPESPELMRQRVAKLTEMMRMMVSGKK